METKEQSKLVRRSSGGLSTFVALTALIGMTGFRPVAAQPSSAAPTDDMVRAAYIVGTPLLEKPAATEPAGFDDTWDRLLRIYRYRDWSAGDSNLASAWTEIQQKTFSCLTILSAIAKIDNLKPTGWDIFLKTMRDNNSDSKKFDRDLTVLERVLAEGSKLVLQQQLRDREFELYTSIGALKSVGDGLARGPMRKGIAIGYLPSWRGVYLGDVLEMRNDSGTDFTNGAVAVTVRHMDGRSVTHIHYVERWQNGSTLGAWYPYYAGDYSKNKAFDDPTSIEVAAYSGGAISIGRRDISEQELDATIRRYCSELRFAGSFLGEYVENGSGKFYPPGFRFTFDGLSALPVKSVLIRFYSAEGRAQEVIWEGRESLQRSKYYVYRSDLFSKSEPAFGSVSAPAHVEVVLEFAGTSYRHTTRFY